MRKSQPSSTRKRPPKGAALGIVACLCLISISACTPTVRVEVAPINIYARLDADVRVRLDQEVQQLIQQNPDLF